MAYLVLLCTVFAFFAQNHAASRSSPSRVSLLMGSEPVFGALIAAYGFGERIGPWGWAGGLLIVCAAWWVTMPAREASGRVVASDAATAGREILPLVAAHGIQVQRFERIRPSLEDIFLRLTAASTSEKVQAS